MNLKACGRRIQRNRREINPIHSMPKREIFRSFISYRDPIQSMSFYSRFNSIGIVIDYMCTAVTEMIRYDFLETA